MGKVDRAVEELSALLDTFYTEVDGWLELADIYLSYQQCVYYPCFLRRRFSNNAGTGTHMRSSPSRTRFCSHLKTPRISSSLLRPHTWQKTFRSL